MTEPTPQAPEAHGANPEDETAPAPSWRARLASRLAARREALLDRGIAFLQARKHGGAAAEAPGPHPVTAEPAPRQAAPRQAAPREPAQDETPSQPAGEPAKTRRNVLIAAALIVAAALGGMGFSYSLLGLLIDDGAARVHTLKEQIDALNARDRAREAQTIELMKKLDDEQAKRAQAEERIVAYELRIMEHEARARAPLTPPAPAPAQHRPAAARQPSAASTFAPSGRGRAGDCSLKPGSYGETLKRCIDEFNRN